MTTLAEEIQRIRDEDPEKLRQVLESLSEEEAHAIYYDPDLWLRPKQVVQDWWPEPIIMFMAGRGFGKSYLSIQYLRKMVRRGLTGQVSIVCPTQADSIHVYTLNGIIPLSDPIKEAPEYQPSKARIVWKDGTVARLFSAESGAERIRGSNSELLIIDELGSFDNKDVFDQAMLTLRVGMSKCLITTTPRATETIIDLYQRAVFDNEPPQEGKDVRIIRGTSLENPYLSDTFKQTILNSYKGTRLERQEIYGELMLSNEGALWGPDLLIKQTLKPSDHLPAFERVSIGIDPAVSTGKHSDKTGIVVSVLGEDGYAYVIGDYTDRYSPDGWARKVVGLYNHYSQIAPTSIVVESNQGGELVADNLRRFNPLLPIDKVFSTKSKISRAEPIAMLYEQGKIFHVRGLNDLEQEMTSYEGRSREKSPDHLDACVFSLTHLMPSQKNVTSSFELMF